MKETLSDSASHLQRRRSWIKIKAYGPTSSSKAASREPTLPVTNSPLIVDVTAQDHLPATPRHHGQQTPSRLPHTDVETSAAQPSQPATSVVVDSASHVEPPATPPPQVEGQGTVVRGKEYEKKNIAIRFWLTAKSILLSSYVNLLLVFVPIGIAAKVAHLSPGIVFGMNAVAIIPLAGLLSHATESVAKRMGDTVGSLMNVTFGNAVELIIFIIALSKNEIAIVQASLLGSILSNLLLILGMCFLIGGLRFREQMYNSTVTQMSACLLSLSVMSLLLPTAFHASFDTQNQQSGQAEISVLKVSRGTSVVLLIVYGMYLLFQLKSHAYMYQSVPQHIIDEESAPGPVAVWLESSSDDSSSSVSDSDASSSSNTTAKRIRRVMRGGRKRRKSSAGSKETNEADPIRTRTPSFVTLASRVYPDGITDDSALEPEPQSSAIDTTDDLNVEEKRHHSRQNSFRGHSLRKERTKDRKRKEKREQKAGLSQTHPIVEGVVDAAIYEKQAEDINEPRRVDFAIGAVRTNLESIELESTAKRAFTLRNIRPQLPKTLSQNVFSQSSMPAVPPPPTGPIPHVRYGIRRTNSLPDRLDQTRLTRAVTQTTQPVYPNTAMAMALANKAAASKDANISRTTAICLLLLSTGLVAVCAEFMVDSINAVVESQSGLSETFIGLIILPIVSNAAEHVTAVTVAAKNKMDLAIGVAVGSSIQIALFVTPFIVLLGWCMDKEMSLYFTLFETVSLFVSAFIVNFLVLDGRSNYLEGSLLCAAYVIIAVAAFFYPSLSDQSELGGNPNAASRIIRSLVGF